MTRTDHIVLLDKVHEMLAQVGEFIDRTHSTAGEPTLTDAETKLAKDLRKTIDGAADQAFKASAISYRVRDDRRREGDLDQAEFSNLTMPVPVPRWFKDKRREEKATEEEAKAKAAAKKAPKDIKLEPEPVKLSDPKKPAKKGGK